MVEVCGAMTGRMNEWGGAILVNISGRMNEWDPNKRVHGKQTWGMDFQKFEKDCWIYLGFSAKFSEASVFSLFYQAWTIPIVVVGATRVVGKNLVDNAAAIDRSIDPAQLQSAVAAEAAKAT